jgi:putative hydrolase of the HAD superfamily
MSYSILFDIGNVIVNFDFQISVKRIAPMCSVAPEEIFHNVIGLKDELETGRISSEEFLDQVIDRVGYKGERDFLVNAFQDVFELNEDIVDLIESESREGTPLYLLSNTNGIHVPFLFEKFPVFHLFDDAVYSHEVGSMKPDSDIYEKAIAKLGIAPEKTIYIDDLLENHDAGKAHGFRAIHYQKSGLPGFVAQFEAARNAILNDL